MYAIRIEYDYYIASGSVPYKTRKWQLLAEPRHQGEKFNLTFGNELDAKPTLFLTQSDADAKVETLAGLVLEGTCLVSRGDGGNVTLTVVPYEGQQGHDPDYNAKVEALKATSRRNETGPGMGYDSSPMFD